MAKTGRWTRRSLASLLIAISLLAGSPSAGYPEFAARPSTTGQDPPTLSAEKVKAVLEQPIHDFNLLQKDVAPILRKAVSAPYAPAGDCQSIKAELRELDAALGADLDLPEAKESFKTKAVNTTLDGARDAASSVIPYRGAVRFVTGAEKHDRAKAKATLAGAVRRGYLKGIAQEGNCSLGPAGDTISPSS